jgi:hypothetical protein
VGTANIYAVHLGPATQTAVPPSEINNATTYTSDLTVQGAFTSQGIDDNANATAITIDSSENVIVGKTSTAIENVGASLMSTGRLIATAENDDVVVLRRNSSDGDLISLRKDGTTVGSIGTVASEVYIGNGDTGLYFASGNNDIRPYNISTQNSVDNSIDLGRSATRFKDLYLSGGVYLGGTGSANLLDDYEEGTFTPTLEGTSGDPTVSYVAQKGSYVKVGRVVHCTVQLQTSSRSGGAGNCRVGGFPFTCNQSTVGWQSGSVAYTNNFTSAPTRVMMQNGLNSANLYTCDSTSNPRADHSTGFGTSLWANAGDLYFAISYETNS